MRAADGHLVTHHGYPRLDLLDAVETRQICTALLTVRPAGDAQRQSAPLATSAAKRACRVNQYKYADEVKWDQPGKTERHRPERDDARAA